MKILQTLKTLAIIAGSCIALFIVGIIAPILILGSNSATNPRQIARKAHLKLPKYEIVDKYDNMDRGASAWSDYYFELKAKKPLEAKYLEKISKRDDCIKTGDTITIASEKEDRSYYIDFIPAEDKIIMDYSFWDAFF